MDNETPEEAEKTRRIRLILTAMIPLSTFVGHLIAIIIVWQFNLYGAAWRSKPAPTPAAVHAKHIGETSPEMLKELQNRK
jgi:hypothetical protein